MLTPGQVVGEHCRAEGLVPGEQVALHKMRHLHTNET